MVSGKSNLGVSVLFAISTILMAQTSKPVAGKPAPATLPASMERGKKVYTEQCLACHQADGLGVSNLNPPLVKTKWVLGEKGALIQIVLKGLNTEIEVDGDSYHNVMASHEYLTDQQIADVLTYVRNSFGNKAKAVLPGEVKSVRAKTKKS